MDSGVYKRPSCHMGRGSRLFALICATALVTLVAVSWRADFSALAVEVDASGAAAPTGFADIVERVRPAVVGVRVKMEERGQAGSVRQALPFPLESNPPAGASLSLGSGFLVSGDGYIVTNNHVVDGGRSIDVTTDDGKVYAAKLIGTDRPTDLALIKIAVPGDLPYLRLAKGEPRIGEWVLAIGNPFGLGGTVTAGIVSGRGRDIGGGPYDDFIQIDAPVNKGNSGGPTFNVRGEVIGVNTAIYSPSGGSIGVAFDIPAETVKLVIQQLKDRGRVTRGWIGVEMQAVTPTLAEALRLKQTCGALIAKVEPNGPAAEHGIEVGDVIVSIDDLEVKDPRELARVIAGIAPHALVKFGVFRSGKEETVVVKVGEQPPGADVRVADTTENAALGLTLISTHSVLAAWERGVVIMGISPEGAAADSGLQFGDVILSVEGRAVSSPADVSRIVDDARAQAKRAILLRFSRGEMSGFAAIPIG